jgi:glycosyltransferase involved in cell wall biosynthesis
MTEALMPPVGVVITNHNNEAFVGQAIESVARQTVRNIHVIIIDDASTDTSDVVIRQILGKLNDSRFHYVRLNSNCGQAGAIRRGLESLNTPFVCFLDSDDFWYENFIARHLAAHLNSDFPVALTYCDSHIVDAAGYMLAGTAWWFDHKVRESAPSRLVDPTRIPQLHPESGRLAYAERDLATLHSCWSPEWASNSMASMMFRRSFVDLVLILPNDELRLYVDFYLSTFAALFTGTVALQDALYAYRMHGANKHSDSLVWGGPYNSSTKSWEPIRDSIWRQVFGVLQSEAGSLRNAFGTHRHEQALFQIRSALRGSSGGGAIRNSTRLRDFFRAP